VTLDASAQRSSEPAPDRREAAGLDKLDDETFLAGFETGTLPPAGFKHPEHVRAAWLVLRRYGPAEALARSPAALRLLAAAAGKPDLYHETVTWTWLLLIHERMARGGAAAESGTRSGDAKAGDPTAERAREPGAGWGGSEPGGMSWELFRRANPDLFERGGPVLRRFYREETLHSALARRIFVLPDRLATAGPRASAPSE
jgi:hypothetical protein